MNFRKWLRYISSFKRKDRALFEPIPGEPTTFIPTELPANPDEFSRYCRRHLDIDDKEGLFSNQLQQLVENLELAPVAIFNPGHHWTLITSVTPEGLRIYDPLSGLKEVSYSSVHQGRYFRGDSSTQLGQPYLFQVYLLKERDSYSLLLEDNYSLPEEQLQRLGITQQANDVNCGELCLYAAAVAKGRVRL